MYFKNSYHIHTSAMVGGVIWLFFSWHYWKWDLSLACNVFTIALQAFSLENEK